MRLYLSMFRMRFVQSMQYRGVAFAHIAARVAWGLMEILAFAAFYRGNAAAFPMPFSQLVSYVWMQQVMLVLFSVVFGDGDIYSAIESGAIAYELVRPASLYGRWFAQSAASRVAFTVMHCLPALLVAMLLPGPYRLLLPPGVGQMLAFLLSTVLALGVVVALAMLMYISLFYIISQRGVRIIVTAVTLFLSGGVIPLPFFPATMQAVIRWLPFAAMQNMPLRIYSGNIAGNDAWWGMGLQVAWLTVLFFTGRLMMRRALQKVVVQGG